jgi:hypothetical protein
MVFMASSEKYVMGSLQNASVLRVSAPASAWLELEARVASLVYNDWNSLRLRIWVKAHR